MAGEWLKLELNTADKPEVLKMARILSVDKDLVLGKLLRVWSWFNKNSVDGHVDGVVADDIDSIALLNGFCSAMKQVGWLDFDDSSQYVCLPNFDRHNGDTAKNRALKNERQARWRKGVVEKSTTSTSTKASTREEKRREDIKTKAKKSDDLVLPDFIEKEIWNDFKEMRKRIRKTMTEKAEELMIKKLTSFHEKKINVTKVLEQSILNNWQDVFEPKQSNVVEVPDWKAKML